MDYLSHPDIGKALLDALQRGCSLAPDPRYSVPGLRGYVATWPPDVLGNPGKRYLLERVATRYQWKEL